MIDLRQLQHFLAVVQAGGVRGAARRVPVSPSSVVRSVKMLETHYGVPLLVRRGKRVEPTAFGTQLAEEVRALVAGFEGIASRLDQVADLSRGTVRVGLSPSVADVFLPQVGARFLREHPGVRMETRMSHATEMLAWLVGRDIDVAIGDERPFAIHGGLVITKLYIEQVPLWIRVGHPLARRRRISVGDLVDYPFVSQFLPGVYQSWFEGVCEAAAKERPGCRVNHAQQCTSYPLLLRLALDSDAVLLSPSLNVLTSPWADRFVRLDLAVSVGVSPVSAATLQAPPPSPLTRRFVGYLQESVEVALRESAAKVARS